MIAPPFFSVVFDFIDSEPDSGVPEKVQASANRSYRL